MVSVLQSIGRDNISVHRAKCFRPQSPELWKYRAVDVRENIVFESLLVLFLESLGHLVHEFSVHGLHCDAGESVVIGKSRNFGTRMVVLWEMKIKASLSFSSRSRLQGTEMISPLMLVYLSSSRSCRLVKVVDVSV